MLQLPNDPEAPVDCGQTPSDLQVVFLASMQQLPPDALEHVAHYFRTLSEANRTFDPVLTKSFAVFQASRKTMDSLCP